MKVAIVNRHDIKGGAAKAAFRLFQALRANGVDASMNVNSKKSEDAHISRPLPKIGEYISLGRNAIGTGLARMLTANSGSTLSPALLPSRWPNRLNASDNDIVNLHWVNGEMLSVADIAAIKKPVVWTLHDMWAFCGAEHYAEHWRWQDGYYEHNRTADSKGIDLERFTWNKKKKIWQKPIQIVTPSHWLAECVRSSALMHDWPVKVIHNAIDTGFWRPLDKLQARSSLGFPTDANIIMFGAVGGSKDPRKGFELLERALYHLREKLDKAMLVVVGQSEPEKPPELGFPVHFTGHISNDDKLRELYCAVDMVVIPSKQDNLPNMGVEALACGRPVVAFDTCGLPDLVKHRKTGYLAKAFDTQDLANGMAWVVTQKQPLVAGTRQSNESLSELELQSRQYAEESFAYSVVAKQYKELFADLM